MARLALARPCLPICTLLPLWFLVGLGIAEVGALCRQKGWPGPARAVELFACAVPIGIGCYNLPVVVHEREDSRRRDGGMAADLSPQLTLEKSRAFVEIRMSTDVSGEVELALGLDPSCRGATSPSIRWPLKNDVTMQTYRVPIPHDGDRHRLVSCLFVHPAGPNDEPETRQTCVESFRLSIQN